jgi:hypothetical protein
MRAELEGISMTALLERSIEEMLKNPPMLKKPPKLT